MLGVDNVEPIKTHYYVLSANLLRITTEDSS